MTRGNEEIGPLSSDEETRAKLIGAAILVVYVGRNRKFGEHIDRFAEKLL